MVSIVDVVYNGNDIFSNNLDDVEILKLITFLNFTLLKSPPFLHYYRQEVKEKSYFCQISLFSTSKLNVYEKNVISQKCR